MQFQCNSFPHNSQQCTQIWCTKLAGQAGIFGTLRGQKPSWHGISQKNSEFAEIFSSDFREFRVFELNLLKTFFLQFSWKFLRTTEKEFKNCTTYRQIYTPIHQRNGFPFWMHTLPRIHYLIPVYLSEILFLPILSSIHFGFFSFLLFASHCCFTYFPSLLHVCSSSGQSSEFGTHLKLLSSI